LANGGGPGGQASRSETRVGRTDDAQARGGNHRLVTRQVHGTLTSGTATADEKKWAMSVLSAAAGGIIGYLVKK